MIYIRYQAIFNTGVGGWASSNHAKTNWPHVLSWHVFHGKVNATSGPIHPGACNYFISISNPLPDKPPIQDDKDLILKKTFALSFIEILFILKYLSFIY